MSRPGEERGWDGGGGRQMREKKEFESAEGEVAKTHHCHIHEQSRA